jgi:hypothetical protein
MHAIHQLRTAAVGVPCAWPPRKRVLYFDIDGTLVRPTFGPAKRALAGGRFERLVREAGFDRLVCVSDAVLLSRAVIEHCGCGGEVHPAVYRFCNGTFSDRKWFRHNVDLVQDPTRRASEIDFDTDWYYVDDHAYKHLALAGLDHVGAWGRTLSCDPHAEGHDIVAWLRGLAEARPPGAQGRESQARRYPLSFSERSSSYVRRRE